MANTINIGAKITVFKSDNYKYNDIIAFKFKNEDDISCLRIVGLPGDKIEIIKGVLYINEREFPKSEEGTSIYTVYSKNPNGFKEMKKFNFKPYSEFYGMVSATRKQYREIVEKHIVDSIYQLGFDSTYKFNGIVETRDSKYFNHYYFGPIRIPIIGDTLYRVDYSLVKGFCPCDGESLIVNEDYFFCLGDSFSDALDSRILGLVPKSKILGVVKKVKNTNVITLN